MKNAYASDEYIGLEPPPPHLRFDIDRLRAWVGDRLDGFDQPIQVEKFKGGQSNPTYRIRTRARNYVLRRKPPGNLRPTAHAIDREFRVLTALVGKGVPIPHPHLYCDDKDVIGSPFYLVDEVDGVVHWNAELPENSAEYRAGFYHDLTLNLAKIHKVDWKKAGLGDFGKPAQYTRRNLNRWHKVYCETKMMEISDMDRAAEALLGCMPASEPVSLIHGDYGNHNVIAGRDDPRVRAILDWEMSTIGNPLVDLAHAMRPWLEPPEPETGRPTLADKDLSALGVPTVDQNVALYCAESGIPWTDGGFYLAYAVFRYACMIQGVLHRYATGTAANKTFAHSQERVAVLAKKARELLETQP